MRVFNTSVTSTKVFVTSAKCILPLRKSVGLQHNKRVRLLFGRYLEKNPNRLETSEKIFSNTLFQ